MAITLTLRGGTDSGENENITNETFLRFDVSGLTPRVTYQFQVSTDGGQSWTNATGDFATSRRGDTSHVVEYTLPGTAVDGQYLFKVVQENNSSNSSSPLEVTLDRDADLGDDLAVDVLENLITSGELSAISYEVAGLDSDARGRVTFTQTLEDGTVISHIVPVTSNGEHRADLSAAGFHDGTVQVSISARDVARNTATGAPDSFLLDIAAPTVEDLTGSFLNRGQAVTVTGTAVDLGTGVASFSFWLGDDEPQYIINTGDPLEPLYVDFKYGAPALTKHELNIEVSDFAGNIALNTYSWTSGDGFMLIT